MYLQNLYIPELQYEVMLTEKFFNRIPMKKFNWRAHPKSMNIMELSNHLAEIPGYVTAIIEKDEMDIAGYKAPQLETKEELIKLLRENASRAEAALRKPNEKYEKIWKMVHGEKKLIEMQRINTLRTMTLSQLPQHRAQLGVYFRLLYISVPASYGPSADEN